MKRLKTDAQTGLQYELQGDYYVIAGDDNVEGQPIRTRGRRNLHWLK